MCIDVSLKIVSSLRFLYWVMKFILQMSWSCYYKYSLHDSFNLELLFDPGSPVDAYLFLILVAFVSVLYYLMLLV